MGSTPWDAAWRQATGRLWGRFHEAGIEIGELPVQTDLPQVLIDPALCRGVFELLFLNALPNLKQGDRLSINAAVVADRMALTFGPLPVPVPSADPEPVADPNAAAPRGLGLAEARLLLQAFGGSIRQEAEMVVMELPLAS